jgi:hypothetical protein
VERVPLGDAVKDTDTVPHELADADEHMVCEPDGLTVLLLTFVTDELNDAETVGEEDSVVEIVDDGESVPDPDCDSVSVPHGDAVNETDEVKHKDADADSDDSDDADGLNVALLQLDTDGLYDDDTVGDDEYVPDGVNELDSVVEIVGDVESVPEPDCDIDRVPHGDASGCRRLSDARRARDELHVIATRSERPSQRPASSALAQGLAQPEATAGAPARSP